MCAQLHGARNIRNAVKALIRAFESQQTLDQVVEHLQPPELGDKVWRIWLLDLSEHRGSQESDA